MDDNKVVTMPYTTNETADEPNIAETETVRPMVKIPLNKAIGIQREMILCAKDLQGKVQQAIDKADWDSAKKHSDRLTGLLITVSYLENKFTNKGFENI